MRGDCYYDPQSQRGVSIHGQARNCFSAVVSVVSFEYHAFSQVLIQEQEGDLERGQSPCLVSCGHMILGGLKTGIGQHEGSSTVPSVDYM